MNSLEGLEAALDELKAHGLLLLHDKELLSVSKLVAEEPVGGSWWSHPAGPAIFRVSEALDDRDDVISVKLVAGKVTFVERRLWPALLAVATSGDDWQTAELSAEALQLLAMVEKAGSLRSDELTPVGGRKPGTLARELEERLLVMSRQIHTESGKHAKVLESWSHWSEAAGVAASSKGYAELEEATAGLRGVPRPPLPWNG